MKVSLIVVCHRSSGVLRDCVESFRREAGAAGVEAEVIAVEQSEDSGEVRRVADASVDVLLERPNRGYAAGLNAGVAEAGGEVLLLANPDISFFDGSVGALMAALREGFDVVGPQFVWDADGAVLLPPAEDPSPSAELSRGLRRRWRWAWSRGLSRCLEETWRAWTVDTTLAVNSLRGALLAAPRGALDQFGPFDEGYFLYYEETEWLWRARRRGARLGLAAGARVQHRWGHATQSRDDAVELEERSRQRFLRRNYGGLWRWALGSGVGRTGRAPITAQNLLESAAIPEREADLWLASPNPHLMPALGCTRAVGLPREFADFCRTWGWVVAAADRDGSIWCIADAWTWGG